MNRRILTLLALATLSTVSPAAAQDMPEASPDAIAEHVQGLRLYLAQDYQGSIPHFLRAHELDPTFWVPVMIAAVNAGNAGLTALTDSLWKVVADNRGRLGDYYGRLADIYLMRRNGGDWDESMVLSRKLADDYPGSKAAYNYGLWSNNDGRPRNALATLATLDPDKEPMKGWLSFFSVKCNALHWVEDHATELRCGQDAAARFPDRGAAHWQVVQSLAAQGRTQELAKAVEDAARHPDPLSGFSQGNILGSAGLDLKAHGHDPALAADYLKRAVAWYAALPTAEAQRPAMRRQRAFWQYANGDYKAAYEAMKGIAADLGSISDQGYVGIVAALAGDAAAAKAMRERFLAGEFDQRPPVRHYWAGMIAAALGDRKAAAADFELSWGGFGDHREPVLLEKMKGDAATERFVRPRG